MTTGMTDSTDGDPKSPHNSKDEPPKLPFVTTSDVLNRLNTSLKEMQQPDDALEPRFELQRKLPDGSTIPASQADIAYSDLQTKLQQSAAFVAQLLPSDRPIWADDQRLAGNAYFAKGDYKTAMDIYLTCLVVKQDSADFVKTTLVPVLNNLAQCASQLGMHKKTMEFCEIALEECKKYPTAIDAISKCKLYFKRAKARRLKGQYILVREDLNLAASCLSFASSEATTSDKEDECKSKQTELAPYEQAIQKEFRLLEKGEVEARKNQLRQKRAMQKALSQPKQLATANTGTASSTEKGGSIASPLHVDQQIEGPRHYSTLRARKPEAADTTGDSETEFANGLSYYEYYWRVIAQVAEALLLWLGDDETKEKIKKRID